MGYWEAADNHWVNTVAAVESSATSGPVIMRPIRRFALMQPTAPIAITGLRGAGKTLLYDSLIGKVGSGGIDYKIKGRSDDVEKHKTFIKGEYGKMRVGTIVIPGQNSDERGAALEKYLSGSKFPTGVIHVVCWGYNQIWESYERQSVSRQLSASGVPVDIEAVREWNKRQELQDFIETCQRLKDAWRGLREKVWLIVAVAKCDLFWSDRDAARHYYIPGAPVPALPGQAPGESPFCEVLRDLIGYIGAAKCEYMAVVPVSCYQDEYMFEPGVMQAVEANPARTQMLVSRFRSLVGEFCVRQASRRA